MAQITVGSLATLDNVKGGIGSVNVADKIPTSYSHRGFSPVFATLVDPRNRLDGFLSYEVAVITALKRRCE